jgi:hypothetical protein
MNMGADHRRDAIRAYFKDQQDHLNGWKKNIRK